MVPADVLAAARQAFETRTLADLILPLSPSLTPLVVIPANGNGHPQTQLVFGSGREQIWLRTPAVHQPHILWVDGVDRHRVEVALRYARLDIVFVQRGRLPICFRAVRSGLFTVIVHALTEPPGERRRTTWIRI